MRYLLDTNVVSELVKRAPHPSVVRWIGEQSALDLAISVLTVGELTKGIGAMAPGHRRTELDAWVATAIPRQFVGRLLPIDEATAREWGRLSAAGRMAGRELPAIDGLLLATASVRGLTFVTRNDSDCAGRGVPVLNPWA